MEQSFLAWLRGRQRDLPQVDVGIGDDAAVLTPRPGVQTVIASDGIVDGVDFLCDQHSLADIGRKSVAINLSDMAAMGAVPTAILVNLSLPEQAATQTAAGVYEGILAICAEHQLAIAGGDITVYDGPLAISVTILGEVPAGRAWLRSGAVDGDAILVSGAFGGSLLGRHLNFTPRVQAALRLRETVEVHAAMDVSDGLSLDLDRLCAASGVGAELDMDSIPIHDDAQRMAAEQDEPEPPPRHDPVPVFESPMQHALGDGEDFELILAVSQADADRLLSMDIGVPLTQIGHFTGRTGLWMRKKGRLERLSPSGYVHGAAPSANTAQE
ncbi:thiamine-phosphate kinase [Roseimaritima ulvae]|uniref:Thiamine-monophosphate kinase n=1 Tax=Roseimaritima ulvae TaxID=980254 RepID=A0A5B9QWD3_9BACT|nr:thiamine-phosphate kinase [Roseimaritima ulvae]QEG42090.1 Thiamine-monophosphate kinase [Roseimaritima ulvae]